MALLNSPSDAIQSTQIMPKWVRKCERYCCLGVTYFPLFFVYSLTTWAVWVETTIGFLFPNYGWAASFLGIFLFVMLNWSYTTAVFTSPGTTTISNGYQSLPTQVHPVATNFTVKANGELRYCKKCQARKPDRAHHCSTCRTCILKMDHHCPWLATCVGLRNYKAFLLFLIYTSLFCFVCFGVSGYRVWKEISGDGEFTESLMPINYVMLVVISGIIGLLLAGFTGWHMLLASRNQTTIECLEKTRYLSSMRGSGQLLTAEHRHDMEYSSQFQAGTNGNNQICNGPDRPRMQHNVSTNYNEYERAQSQLRYEEYLDEQDSAKLPNAFDLGWRMNLLHLFGPRKILWFLPVVTTHGDGWSWEPNPQWLQVREKIAQERDEQRQREYNAGWGVEPLNPNVTSSYGESKHALAGSSPITGRFTGPYKVHISKADRILGRTGGYTDEVSMDNLRPIGSREQSQAEDNYNVAETSPSERRFSMGLPQKVGFVPNKLLANTMARKKDDCRFEGHDEEVD
ncbi:BgTH12-03123 [Blumeria graminis f. sp. triticale]|uniref:Palmitoyltransferase n=3 Tax=Blumeria graminis TaxID=34373 RepID=A0A061HMV1_BLUGR|nr:Palmitoyltransferase [Blumeria graminis f. sp. tritici 96224]CAD6503459.1 BgTH12-03123 [Blumeria graminis f. sp. triticale]VDB89550.1 Bgt-1663 [Blumeria graminis f. sp. tritici]